MTSPPSDPFVHLVQLAVRVIEGDDDALDDFWIGIFDEVESWVTHPRFLGGIAVQRDCVGDIVLATWERLYANDFRRLRDFFERSSARSTEDRAPHFRNWLHLVARTAAIDYQRSQSEYERKPASPDASPRYWRTLVGLTSRKGAIHDPVTLRRRANECLEFLDRWVPEIERQSVVRKDEGASDVAIAALLGLATEDEAKAVLGRAREHLAYRPAIQLWSQGLEYDAIAQALALSSPKDAERIVRAAKQVLRHHFRPENDAARKK